MLTQGPLTILFRGFQVHQPPWEGGCELCKTSVNICRAASIENISLSKYTLGFIWIFPFVFFIPYYLSSTLWKIYLYMIYIMYTCSYFGCLFLFHEYIYIFFFNNFFFLGPNASTLLYQTGEFTVPSFFHNSTFILHILYDQIIASDQVMTLF